MALISIPSIVDFYKQPRNGMLLKPREEQKSGFYLGPHNFPWRSFCGTETNHHVGGIGANSDRSEICCAGYLYRIRKLTKRVWGMIARYPQFQDGDVEIWLSESVHLSA